MRRLLVLDAAVVQHRYGPAEVLAVEEIDKPGVGNEVLNRVHAAGLDADTGFVMRGVPY